MIGSLVHTTTSYVRFFFAIAFGVMIMNPSANGFMVATKTLKNTQNSRENVINVAYPSGTVFRMPLLMAKKINKPTGKQISDERRNQLGIPDNEDEYDLGVALNANTDPLITKIIAGSFILVVAALLVAGIILPSLTDYGDGVCNPIKTAGRC